MKTSTKIIIAIIILACLGFIFWPKINSGNSEEKKTANTEQTENNKLTVNAIVLENKQLNNDLKVTGSLTANESVTLRTEVSGVVDNIYFKEGQKVKKGQRLVQLNDDDLRAQLSKLQYTKKLNEDIENRQKQLFEREAISKEEYETALTTLKTSIADIEVTQAEIRQHQIKAPFDGTIGLRQISVGSYLNPADDIATLYSINPIKIDFSVPGKYVSEVNVGDKINFTVDAYTNESFDGEIYAIEPRINTETRSISLRAICDNKDGKLLPGQFAKITVTISTFETALMVPTEAVIPELNGKRIFVMENGVVGSKSIETGIRTSDRVQVTTGLNAGDTVITTGILQLRTGMEVNLNLGDVTYE